MGVLQWGRAWSDPPWVLSWGVLCPKAIFLAFRGAVKADGMGATGRAILTSRV